MRQDIDQNMLNCSEKIPEQNGSSGLGISIQFWIFLRLLCYECHLNCNVPCNFFVRMHLKNMLKFVF